VAVLREVLATHKLVLANVTPDFPELPVPTLTTVSHRLPLLEVPMVDHHPVPEQTRVQFVLIRTNNVEVVLVVLAILPLVSANAVLAALELLAVLLTVSWFPLAESQSQVEACNAQFAQLRNKNVVELNTEVATEPLELVTVSTDTLVVLALRNILTLLRTSASLPCLTTAVLPPQARLPQRRSCFLLSSQF